MPPDDHSRVRVSKSRFMAGVQCLKRLYLQVHQPELAAEPDESAQVTMRQGQEVGELARDAFPGGVLVEAGDLKLAEAINRTSQLVADRDVQTIFEGTFKQDDIIVRTDILARKPRGRWRLIEVKASTDIKEHHPYDVGIQKHVLNAAHVEAAPCLMHLNRNYVYNGREYDLGRLFKIEKMGPEIEKLRDKLPEMIRQQRMVLSQPVPPEIEPGPQCKDPVRCEFYDYCNKPLPDDHVQLLPGISSTKVNQLAARGIISVQDIPADFPLSERQWRACRCVQTQTPYFAKGLIGAIGQLTYPLFFMDFETLNPALPRFEAVRPYDPIPFQWSVHVRKTPGGQTEHDEFLAEDESDPRLPFLSSLLEVLGQEGHVIVYNRGFESQRLEELAGWLPAYARRIAQVRTRLWDLLDAIRKNVYHPRFRGSFSLKSVLPVLVPDMTYEGMEVSEGEEAGQAWEKMVRGQVSAQEKARLRKALLDYCSQDTLAMVRLLDFLAAARPIGP
jgi:CRISPR/Cas system-associated exonuclease Cas4 (RecB family)